MTAVHRREHPARETAESVCGRVRLTWLQSVAGAAAMAAVQPPLDLWWAAWVAPLPWMLVAKRARPLARGDWWAVYVGGLFFWLAALHWLRLPHPATSIGWVVLSAYLALYVPLWMLFTRRLVNRGRLPFVLAAPLAWVASEHLRGWLLGGFTMAGLCDTQCRWLSVLQAADLFGAVGLSGLVAAVAACLTVAASHLARVAVRSSLFRCSSVSGNAASGNAAGSIFSAAGPLLGATGLVAAAAAYGHWRLADVPADDSRRLQVLLVQGSIDTQLKQDPAAAEQLATHYDDLTLKGLLQAPPPDLIVWPETMWRWGLIEIDPAEQLPASVLEQVLGSEASEIVDPAAAQQAARTRLAAERIEPLAAYARRYGATWLVGLDKQVITPAAASGYRNYNCGLFLDADGTPLGCYEKMYPVLFGEYVPLADRFPWLYRLTPLPAGLTAGRRPLAVDVAGFSVAATICYESTLPRGIRGIVRELEAAGQRPDVFANLTNDGWFWGSSELDMHLSAAVLRAVECRTPVVVAANTGISASIDGSGRVLARGPKRATASLRSEVRPDGRVSPFLIWGTLPTGLTAVAAVAVVGAAGFSSLSWRLTEGFSRRKAPRL
jgi:apolipoprotein N-acyltransferase